MSFPPVLRCFSSPGSPPGAYVFRPGYPIKEGFPHSEIRGSTIARISPQLIAACHVLHRLLAPRHPPNALHSLIIPPPARRTNTHRQPSEKSQSRKGDLRVQSDKRSRTETLAASMVSTNPISRQAGLKPLKHQTSSHVNEHQEPLGRDAHHGTDPAGVSWKHAPN